jgi:hypothetical protein
MKMEIQHREWKWRFDMEVISVHVPKTAGTTFGRLLDEIYGSEAVLRDYDDTPMNPNAPFHSDRRRWRDQTLAKLQAISPEFRAIHGHFSVRKYNGSFPDARRIAWVRHPVSWLISLYFYWKHAGRVDNPLLCKLQDENIPLLEFAEHPAARDRVSGIFLDGLELDDFFFVGIQEHFDEDLSELTRMMGWPEREIGVENSSPDPAYRDLAHRYRDDRSLTRRIEALNANDMALYERALRLRSRRRGETRTPRRGWSPWRLGWSSWGRRRPA